MLAQTRTQEDFSQSFISSTHNLEVITDYLTP